MQSSLHREILKLVGSTLGTFVFAWMGLSVVAHYRLASWPLGLFSLGFSVISGLAVAFLLSRLKSAAIYHMLSLLVAYIPALLIASSASWILVADALPGSANWVVLLGGGTLLGTAIIQVGVDRQRLEENITHNVDSGRYDRNHLMWDPRIPIHWDAPEKEQQAKRTGARVASLRYLVPGIGYIIARNSTNQQILLLFGFFVFFFAVLPAYGLGRQIATIQFILDEERRNGGKILLKHGSG